MEPVDDDVLTDKKRKLWDSNIKSKEDDDIDPNLCEEAYVLDFGDDINEVWPGSVYMSPLNFVLFYKH